MGVAMGVDKAAEAELARVADGARKPARKPRRDRGWADGDLTAAWAHNKAVHKRNRDLAAGLVAAGVPVKVALPLAGYSANSEVRKDPRFKETVETVRARLQDMPGFTMHDSAKFYKDISENEGHPVAVRVSARVKMDSLLGYDAVKKMEVSEKTELATMVSMLSRMEPKRLAKRVSCREVGVEDEQD